MLKGHLLPDLIVVRSLFRVGWVKRQRNPTINYYLYSELTEYYFLTTH